MQYIQSFKDTAIFNTVSDGAKTPGEQGKKDMQVSGQGELEVHLFYWHRSLLL